MSWALPLEVFAFLRRRLRRPATVIEFGSGEGTANLVESYGSVYTVEHDPAWLGKVHGATYIHAPIVDGWYDRAALDALPLNPDCIVIDGPPGAIGRAGILRHLDLLGYAPLIVDDVHRRPEFELALALASARKDGISLHHLKSGRAFAAIGWEYL